MEGLKEKELIEETNEAGRKINVFDLRRRLHQFAKSHESTLINTEDSRVVGGLWRTNSPKEYKASLNKIWNQELEKYSTVRKVKPDHWCEGYFSFVIACLLYETTIICYMDQSVRLRRSMSTRSNKKKESPPKEHDNSDVMTKIQTQVYVFNKGRVYIKAEDRIVFPFMDAICLYFNQNHYEYVKLWKNIHRSEVRFIGIGAPRKDVMEEDIDPRVTSLKDANSYSTPPRALDKHFPRELQNIRTSWGFTIFTPLSDIGYFTWGPKNATYQALKSITSEDQVLQYIKFDGLPASICIPESGTIQFQNLESSSKYTNTFPYGEGEIAGIHVAVSVSMLTNFCLMIIRHMTNDTQ